MKIVYFGCDPFLSCFEQLIKDGHEIVTLFTFHNPHDWIHEEKIAETARTEGIPIRYDRITMEEADELFSLGRCDVLFSAEYDRLIPIPNGQRFKGINIHNTLLPEGRGFFPVETQVYLRREYGGVSIHKLSPQMDDGDILFSRRFDMPTGAGVEDVYAICADIAAEAVHIMFSDFDAYWESAKPQTGTASVWSPTVRERTITPDMEAAEALHLWRCFKKFSYVSIGGILHRVLDARPASCNTDNAYVWLKPDTVIYKLKEGAVCLKVERK